MEVTDLEWDGRVPLVHGATDGRHRFGRGLVGDAEVAEHPLVEDQVPRRRRPVTAPWAARRTSTNAYRVPLRLRRNSGNASKLNPPVSTTVSRVPCAGSSGTWRSRNAHSSC